MPMRILVHDYVGHPFQVQLSRELAHRGHTVLHLYCSSFVTPHGDLARHANDPRSFDCRGVALSQTIPKTNFVKRLRLEAKYRRNLIVECAAFIPEIILSANAPSIVQHGLAGWCRRHSVRVVSWIQDMYGLAAYRLLSRKLPGIGHIVGRYFIALDKSSARRSDAIVVITPDFREVLTDWGVDPERIHVIHNWAPLESMPLRPRGNEWAQEQKLGNGVRFLYAGTLAMKHNPALLLELARMLDRDQSGELVVVSEGAGVDWLAEQARAARINSLRSLGFQSFGALPDVLGSADVLVAILEPDAGVFSVPSKVLSYFCAGRAVLLAVPKENLAAKITLESGAGLVVEPDDVAAFRTAAERLVVETDLRDQLAKAARQYAEANFDIARIGDQFELILCERWSEK